MHVPEQSALHRLQEPSQHSAMRLLSGCSCRHVRAQLQESGLYTDDAAVLPQTISEVLELIRKHIELKKLEAKEGTEYQVDWHGETPVVQEIRQRPAGRPCA